MRSAKEDGKSAIRKWVRSCLDKLQSKTNQYEAEIEVIATTGNEEDFERSITLEYWVERNKFHTHALEVILRGWENEEIMPEQIDEVRPFMQEYLERREVGFVGDLIRSYIFLKY